MPARSHVNGIKTKNAARNHETSFQHETSPPRRRALDQEDTATSPASDIGYRQRVWAGRSKHLACFGDDLRHSAHRSARAPRRRRARPRRLTGGDAASRQRAPLPPRGGLGSRLLCTRSASTAWRARGRAARAPIRSALQGFPYRGRGGCRNHVFGDLRSSPQIYHEHNRHGFEVLGWSVNFLPCGFNF